MAMSKMHGHGHLVQHINRTCRNAWSCLVLSVNDVPAPTSKWSKSTASTLKSDCKNASSSLSLFSTSGLCEVYLWCKQKTTSNHITALQDRLQKENSIAYTRRKSSARCIAAWLFRYKWEKICESFWELHSSWFKQLGASNTASKISQSSVPSVYFFTIPMWHRSLNSNTDSMSEFPKCISKALTPRKFLNAAMKHFTATLQRIVDCGAWNRSKKVWWKVAEPNDAFELSKPRRMHASELISMKIFGPTFPINCVMWPNGRILALPTVNSHFVCIFAGVLSYREKLLRKLSQTFASQVCGRQKITWMLHMEHFADGCRNPLE